MGYNYNFYSFNKSRGMGDLEKLNPSFIFARVEDVILGPEHPEWDKYGQWNALGAIKFKIINQRLNEDSSKDLPIAYPLKPHLKYIPLKQEIVVLLHAPSPSFDDISNDKRTYYIDVVSLWNHPHVNTYPVTENTKPGNYFAERDSINPLKPFEGDFCIEGRLGNTIRMSSVGPETPWKSDELGSPILIIRNGQKAQPNGYEYNVEDINADASSIYLGNNLSIPLKPASSRYNTYGTQPEGASYFKGNQIILNSDRVFINAKQDSVLMSARSSIGLSSENTINIESKTVINNEAARINLGEKAEHPLLKGDDTIDVLSDLLQTLKSVGDLLIQTTGVPPGAPMPQLIKAGVDLKAKAIKVESRLKSLLSQKSFTS